MTFKARLDWVTGLTWVLCTCTGVAANAEPVPCNTPLIFVDTEDKELHRRVCDIAGSALPVLEQCLLKLVDPVTISFSGELGNPDELCFGLYHQGDEWIELLEPKAFEQAHTDSKSWAALPAAEHFDAIVVHEFTHALVDQTALVERACSADEEYIAYAMQLSTLPDSARDALIAASGVSQPVPVESINQVMFGLSPVSFAVRSWLHFQEPENGCGFVKKIIRGEATLWIGPE